MRKEQKVAKKRKDRKKEARAKVLRRREAIRRDRKIEMERAKKESEFAPKQNPIINLKSDASVSSKDEKIREQLLKNQQILKALEAEYNKEQQTRDGINTNLEGEGHESLQDKLAAMHKKAVESQGLDKEGDAQPVIDLTK
jgi:uncharacterized membrane-anchored protein YjiN (DUF445 family)